MGRHRTTNAGVSIYGSGHKIEKKKRKASDISIFDHVGRADHDATTKEAAASMATVRAAPPILPAVQQSVTAAAMTSAVAIATAASYPAPALMVPNQHHQRSLQQQQQQQQQLLHLAGMPQHFARGPAALNAAAATAAAFLSAATAAAAGAGFAAAPPGMMRAPPAVPMRRTRSRSNLDGNMSTSMPPPPTAMPSAGSIAPVPMQHSVSDIAAAFNLDGEGGGASVDAFPSFADVLSPGRMSSTGSPRSPPFRMTRSRSSNLANWPQLLDANGLDSPAASSVADGLDMRSRIRAATGGPLPMQPTASLVGDALDLLEAENHTSF